MNARPPSNSVVHVVDDDEQFRTAISRLLRAAGYEVCGYPSAGAFLLERTPETQGCVVLDMCMPGPSGLDLQRALSRQDAPLPVIFLTGYGDVPTSVSAMKAGAVDFLTKPVKRDQLLHAVGAAIQRDLKMRNHRTQQKEWRQRLDSLTPREHEVLDRVVAGQPNKQIALELGTAERTVKAHRAQVMEKMKVVSLAELVHLVDKIGIGDEKGGN